MLRQACDKVFPRARRYARLALPFAVFVRYLGAAEVEEVGKILPGLFKRQVRRLNPRVIEVLGPFWRRVAGEAMARESRPVDFKAGTLTLACSCPSWSAQLQQMAEEIRAEVNCFLRGPVVKKIQVRCVASLERSGPQQNAGFAPEDGQANAQDRPALSDFGRKRHFLRPGRKSAPARSKVH